MLFSQNQKLKVKATHKFHPNRVGYFQLWGGTKKDCVVLTDKPIPTMNGINDWFVVGEDDIEVSYE